MTSEARAELTPAYILHSRKYRDTSLIVELLTEQDGRVAAVYRGARSKKKSGVVQPFTPLLVSYMGRGELKTITRLDIGNMNHLVGENLLLGLYANELMVRLCHKFERSPMLFSAYQRLLLGLVSGSNMIHALREFELSLLTELGYGISFDVDASSGSDIDPNVFYRYVPDEGFHPLLSGTGNSYKGEQLLKISAGDYVGSDVANIAKKIIRQSLNHLLGDKPLKSRELFAQFQAGTKSNS